MNDLTADMTPRCVGRYLIDFPGRFVLNSESTAKIEDVTIRVWPSTRIRFDYMLNTRERTLREQHMNGQPGNPKLKDTIVLPDGLGKIFNRSGKRGGIDAIRHLELLAWRDGYAIEMEIEARDFDDPKYRSDPHFKSRSTTVPEKLAHLIKIFERVRGRADDEVPSEMGACIRHGFVKGKPGEEEMISIVYHLDGVEDVYFKVYTDSGLQEDTTLLDRGAAIEAMLKHREGKTLRKGKRETFGIRSEEWLMALRTNDRIQGHDFTLEANSKIGSARTPLLIVDLSNGYRIPGPELSLEESAVRPPLTRATLSEAEAMALWDTVTPTLRPRPGAF